MSTFNGTPHNTAQLGQIAKTVIMPGDPLRAKFIAENFLEDPKEFNHVRGMLGYTGTYKGKKISVMGHGMGIPSMAIYSYELYKFYDVDNIIRVGSCGGYLEEMELFDIILVEAAYSPSSFADVAYGYKEDLFYPDKKITDMLEKTARESGRKIYKGIVHSGDAFYYDPAVKKEPPYKCIAGEMESFALFANAKFLNKKGACLLTISDKKDAVATPEERQTAFKGMIEIALDTAICL
ncbi:MAG: purine-nucleoside phosphorylase [Erysipelotrichaceae bacterium]|nr:purine-nucleoside phosphorylase [Erysipelotrichaceae bacterium]